MAELENLDISWAWAPKEFGGADGPTESQWRHALRRIGFGVSQSELAGLRSKGYARFVAQATEFPAPESDADRQAERLASTILASSDASRLASAWLYRLQHSPRQLVEKMTIFWHGHFATSAEKVNDAQMMWTQNRLLRENALGDFRVLAQSIAKDPAMLVYLDSETNRKAHPNENFARELMELFCLGEGHYTEKDVQELSRTFTGWSIRSKAFRKNKYQQDRGAKTILGVSGAFDGEEAVDIVVDHPRCAAFLAGKLFKEFVCDEPVAPGALLKPLAQKIVDSGMRVGPALAMLFESNLFFSEHSVGRKIRSPIELAFSLVRGLDVSTGVIELTKDLKRCGQALFFPPNVKGWDGGRTWINSSTLLARANLMQRMIHADQTRFGGLLLVEYLDQLGIRSTKDALAHFENQLLAVPIAESRRQQLILLAGSQADKYQKLLHGLATFPEFQLG